MATALVATQPGRSAISLTPSTVFGGTTSFVPATSYKMLVEMFGHPDTPNPISPEALQRPLQPDDILGQYVGRELKMVSSAITAVVLNDRASVMMNIFPPVETLETSFTINSLEPNMTPWSRVASFGIPREITYSSYAEAYTTQRKKQMARIEKNFLLDPNYGPPYIRMLLTTLAANAKMTINMEAMVQAVEQPFRNMFYTLGRRERVDHQKLMNAEQATFGIGNRNQQAFFNSLIKSQPDQPEIAFDTVLGPAGVFAGLRNSMAEAGGPIQCERVEMNPETKRIQSILFSGAKSSARINVASRTIDLLELDVLRINSQNKTDVFRPFVTQMTVCDVIQFEGTPIGQAGKHLDSGAADVYAYVQTPNSGHEERFEFHEALKRAFLFDEMSGLPSGYYRSYVSALNQRIVTKNGVPTSAHPKMGHWQNARDANDENENAAGVDNFVQGELDGRKKLSELDFRSTWFAVTYDPVVELYRVPETIGDFHLKNLRTERVVKAARNILLSRGKLSSGVSNSGIEGLVNLALAIRRAPWTNAWSAAVINTNAPFLQPGGHFYQGSGRHASDGVPQWTPNEYGALRLPADPVGTLTHPPGYDSWAGIQTLAAEGSREGSPWVAAAEEARRAVETLESIYVLIQGALPNSELVDAANTSPWFHVDDGGRGVLFDTLVQMRTGLERGAPVFLRTSAGDVATGSPAAPVATASEAASPLTLAASDKASVDAAVANGRALDQWLSLGTNYNEEARQKLVTVVARIATIAQDRTPTRIVSGEATRTVTGAELAPVIERALFDALQKRTVDDNAILVDALSKGFVSAPDTLSAYTEFSKVISTAPSGKRSKSTGLFTERQRSDGQRTAPVRGASADLDAQRGNVIGAWLRSPLVADPSKSIGTLAVVGDRANAYRTPAGAATVVSTAPATVSIGRFPPALSRALGAQLGSTVSTPAPMASYGDPMDYEAPSLGAALRGAIPMAQTADDLAFVTRAARGSGPASANLGFGASSGPGGMSFFGPWQRRLEYLRNNVPDGAERIVALAILMSRNTLQTHLGVASVGVPFIALEAYRTGIQFDTAALVRLIRGSQTGFTVIARISVVPTLEGVTGDYAVTGELWHGQVFPNRKNLDILLGAYIMNFIAGRYNDYMVDPIQLLSPPVDTQSCFVLAETPEATRREFPCHMFGESYYYQPAARAPSPYAKRTYHGWAAHLVGAEVLRESAAERQRVSYWNAIKRSFIGHRAPTRVMGDHGRFDVRKPGTGGIGRLEFNISNAWEAFMGGQTPTIGEDRITAS